MHWTIRLATAAITVLSAVAGCSQAPQPQSTAPQAPGAVERFAEVRVGALEADANFSSSTIEQWVKQTDHVAVITITAEAEIPPSKAEIERGEGLLGRTVTAAVKSVVWSHPNAQQALPKTFTFNALGWAFKKGLQSKYRVGLTDTPYLLPGHTYLMALRYVEFGCPGRIDAADGPPVKVWSPLGSQAVVPFDGELGAGEFEGRRVTVLEPDQPASFRNEMQGRNLDWIQQELKTVAAKRPDLTHNAGPIGCDGE